MMATYFEKELIEIYFNEYWSATGHIKIGSLDVIDKEMCLNYYVAGFKNLTMEKAKKNGLIRDARQNDFVNKVKFADHYFAGKEKSALMRIAQERNTYARNN